ncbi:MAG: polysaccharide biosynthesis protein [Gammaproteobacteria bacterium]
MIALSHKFKIIVHDIVAIIAAWVLALLARFNFDLPPTDFLHANLLAVPVVVVVQALIARYFRLYRGLWRFASLPDLWNIIRAAGIGAVAIGIVLFAINRLALIPRSMLVLYPLFLIFLLGGPRLFYRVWKDRTLRLDEPTAGQRVIVVGAGTAGEAVIRDMLRTRAYLPVGFIDDDPRLLKARIHGVPVLGRVDDLPELSQRYLADAVIIATPSANGEQMRRIVEACEASGRPFRTLPQLRDVVSGRVGLSDLRDVAIDDLLGRDKVQLDWTAIQGSLTGRNVLVTGGGGSIGSELCRQIAGLGPAHLVVLDHSEFNLYRAELEIRGRFPRISASFILGSVCDEVIVERVFATYKPQRVFHAAAYKHVPILEAQAREALRNNVLGTATVIEAALRHDCERFVLISSDKAVRPTSVMGATKRFAELLCEASNQESRTRFITVRFGNVLGSAGSVVPLFREQIAAGGPVTVTHPEARRYFMTVAEACQLILEAGVAGVGGEIFVLDMGEPVSIRYLAEQMIRLSGRQPGSEIELVYTGLRPGERLTEELFHAGEQLRPTGHDKLLLAQQRPVERSWLDQLIADVRRGVADDDEGVLAGVLQRLRSEPPAVPTMAKVVSLQRGGA